MKKRSADPKAQLERALRLLERGQYRRALRWLEKLLPLAQDNPALSEQVHLAMADAYRNLRDLPQAVGQTEAALELNPKSDRAYYLLGFSHSVNTDWSQAVAALRQALALNPDEAEYYRSKDVIG